MTTTQLLLATAIAAAAGLGIVATTKDKDMLTHIASGPGQLPIEGGLPSFAGATGWLNSPPLTPEGLRGKVVVVDFWTYTCINWLRTLPYVRAWADKYRDDGLVVIGVHTPEFGIEKDLDNIRAALAATGVDYPVAIDSSYGVWNAFRNNSWPALYIIDAQGRMRFHHFGEGRYEESERAIQQLLAEAGAAGVNRDLVAVNPTGLEVAADFGNVLTPETYVGYDRTDNFASGGGQLHDQPRSYSLPARLSLNYWGLAGSWTVGREAIMSNESGARIGFGFHARDLNLVMGPIKRGTPIRFRVMIDGKPPGDAHGSDVDADGNGTLKEQTVYQLIRQPGAIADRRFEIEFLDPSAQAFSFTFG